ncbi:MAG: vanomycin resistance protein VanB, partial [Clostridiaceae bacterium]|nr:vanomycin resistance protein VanB [Clostridiaceae bacterium]
PLRDISFDFLLDEAMDNAYSIGREGNMLERIRTILRVKYQNVNISVKSDFSRQSLADVLNDIKKEVDIKEKDASAAYINGNMVFSKEVIGQELDVDKSIELIENRIHERNFSVVDLCIQKVFPRVMYEDICDIEEVIGSFSTAFNTGKADRSYNIKLACERINNTLLLTGDVFSMDRALGPRSFDNGYRDAPVIIKGRLVEGVGGGVCQVTTTLYAAVLKAKMGIVERTGHSQVLGYVEPGQDATIAEGYIDFKFKNNLEYAVLVNAQVVGNKVVVRLLGKKGTENFDIRLKSVILEEISPGEDEIILDKSLSPGDRAVVRASSKGLRVAVYRETVDKSGRIVDREKISEDLYRPVKGVVKVNYVNDYIY